MWWTAEQQSVTEILKLQLQLFQEPGTAEKGRLAFLKMSQKKAMADLQMATEALQGSIDHVQNQKKAQDPCPDAVEQEEEPMSLITADEMPTND